MEKRRQILFDLVGGHFNDKIIEYINMARTNPNKFSYLLMNNDNINDILIKELALFFNKYEFSVYPLKEEEILTKCAQKMISKFIMIDNGNEVIKLSEEDKYKLKLRKRLEQYNLYSKYYKEFILIGVESPKDVVINLFLMEKHRKILLNTIINYVGVYSFMIPSDRICVVIDIVDDFYDPKMIKTSPRKFLSSFSCSYLHNTEDFSNRRNRSCIRMISKDDNCEEGKINICNNTNKFINNKKKYFDKTYKKIIIKTPKNNNYEFRKIFNLSNPSRNKNKRLVISACKNRSGSLERSSKRDSTFYLYPHKNDYNSSTNDFNSEYKDVKTIRINKLFTAIKECNSASKILKSPLKDKLNINLGNLQKYVKKNISKNNLNSDNLLRKSQP